LDSKSLEELAKELISLELFALTIHLEAIEEV